MKINTKVFMKIVQLIILLSCVISLQASQAHNNDMILNGYTFYEQFVESIENGNDDVVYYCIKKPNFLTKIDPVSGYSTLEIAVIADNEAAVRTMLSLSLSKNIKLPIAMALQKTKNFEIAGILQASLVQQDNR